MIFQKPQYLISPNPGNMQWEQDFAVQSAQLKEQVLNTIVTNPSVNFTRHVKRAARDSFFRFGVLEIGYAADWRNPQKDDPYLESWDDPDIAIDDDKVIEDTVVPENERFYVKRINPARFRVAVSDALDLNDVDWCGYYDFYYTSVLKHTKGIKWPDEYGDGDCLISAEYASGFVGRDRMDIYQQSYNMAALSKVWHIWDRIKHKRLLLLEGEGMYELWSRDFARLPFIDLRWIEEDSGFYPIPPVFDWLSPQDEINEAREQTRSYRRRFTRKFQTLKGQVDEEEKEKFSSGPDGILVEVKSLNAISPIDNPEIGPTSENALTLAKDDFNVVSGTSAEARGQQADRETATQAKLVDQRALIRESAEQMDFSVWLCSVGRELLLQCQEKLVEGMWIQYTQNPTIEEAQSGPSGAQQSTDGIPFSSMPVYRYVSSQDINDGYDFTIQFDVQNATPAAMQQAQTAFVNFLAILNNPMVSLSPAMIREAAYRVGYKNEAIIQEAQKAAAAKNQMMVNQQMAQAQGQNPMAGPQANNPANAAATQMKQMQTPNLEAIGDQISQQLQ